MTDQRTEYLRDLVEIPAYRSPMTDPRNLLDFSISRDDDGTYLRASVCLDGRCFAHEVKLDPILQLLNRRLADYHARLHGDQVAGFGDWFRSAAGGAASVAKRIAASKAAAEVINQVREHQGDIARQAAGLIPGGATLYDAADKVHKVVVAARAGDKVARAKLGAVASLARDGDPQAMSLVDLARLVNAKLAEKETGTVASGRHGGTASDHRTGARGGVVPGGGRYVKPATPGSPAPPPQGANAQALQAYFNRGQSPGNRPGYGWVDGHAQRLQADDSQESPDDQEPDDCDDCDDQVSGWVYNRPYRTVPDHLVDVQKSPGVAIAMREMYNRGLGRPATSRDALVNRALRGHPELSSVYNKMSRLGAGHPTVVNLARALAARF